MALYEKKSDDGDSDVIPISYFAPKDKMPSHSDSEGLQVDMTNAPEVAHLYGQHKLYYNPPEYRHPESEPESEPSLQKKQIHVPFGLGIWTFGLLIGVLVAAVVGAGVGGGCAAALGNCSSNITECTECSEAAPVETISCPSIEPNNTSSENTTDPYVPRRASAVESLELNCPTDFRQRTVFKSNKGYEFSWYCGVNVPAGDPAKGGGIMGDVAPIIAYTLEDCLNACAAMIDRDENRGTGVKCKSVVFDRRMAEMVGKLGANCFLKNGTKPEGGEWGFDNDDMAYAERND
ncbi:hypothetical protein CDV31_007407 [Fusarium ambrosium]|uniref:Apple domain-containing protein n=1 Tax=Fusarium ambrosium TaxID=131363 RepID=A0A428U6R5_9HYPO|nr:hypothetical protein CDV31_007407 [Fusarium ambrosium]